MSAELIDLGEGHTLRFYAWGPDRDLNPQYAGIPDVERYGALVAHPARPDDGNVTCADIGQCEGAITFAGEVQQRIAPRATTWTVESWDPLTLSPSLLCHCGDHGFVRAGKWVTA